MVFLRDFRAHHIFNCMSFFLHLLIIIIIYHFILTCLFSVFVITLLKFVYGIFNFMDTHNVIELYLNPKL